jgi:UDP-N-acetylglucosamine 1-carboxyvinyltransferase
MAKFIVNGGPRLSGEIEPVGNKNSVLKLIPASILFKGDYVLTNVPAISDVQVMLDILSFMGAQIDYDKQAKRVKINTDNMHSTEIPFDLSQKLRASVLFIGPLLARFGEVKGAFPGGDKIGPRELKAHFSGFMQLGAKFEGDEWGKFSLYGDLKTSDVLLYEPSVTGTENLILAAVNTPGKTKIIGAACEPHVQELCSWLSENGVNILGIGSNLLEIEGVSQTAREITLQTQGREHAIWPDYVDVSTGIVAAAITKGALKIKNVRHQDLRTIKFFYDQLGVEMIEQGSDLFIAENQKLEVKDQTWARTKGVYSQPWYSFPSDLMSITIVLGMFVKGSTLFFEKLYPNRMDFVKSFIQAGANIQMLDEHRLIINGPTELKGANYTAPDLRAGMAYFLASLAAQGKSEIEHAEHIDRGYPGTLEKYINLGANIERQD